MDHGDCQERPRPLCRCAATPQLIAESVAELHTRESPTALRVLRGGKRLAALCALVGVILTAAPPALADSYDSKRSGHPLRVLAYVVHPFGVVLDTLIFRPAHWVVSRETLKTLFGHTDE